MNEQRVTAKGHETVRGMKAQQADCSLTETRAPATAPGESLMPDEIVQHDQLDGDRGCGRGGEVKTPHQQVDEQDLEHGAEQARKAEAAELHRQVSSR
jgi:hypothetical protein